MAKLTDTTPLLDTTLQAQIANVLDIVQQLSDSANVTPSLSNIIPKALDSPKLPCIRQSEALNLFNKTSFETYTTCEFTGNFIAKNVTKNGTLTVTTQPADPLPKLSTKPLNSTLVHKIFRVVLFEFSKQGSRSPIVKLSSAKYRFCRRLKDVLDWLYRTSLSYKANHNNSEKVRLLSLEEAPLFKSSPTVKNGIITFELTESFYRYLLSCPPMPIFDWVFKIDIRHHPHAPYLVNKMLDHHNQNYWKPNANIISVKTLLEGCPLLSKNTRRFSQSIREPFERDMDCSESQGIAWEYCNPSREKLSESQVKNWIRGVTYNDFLNLRVLFKIDGYPPREKRKRRSKAKKNNSKI